MKYELKPDNRNCSDEVLIDDLRAVVHRLGKQSITRNEYDEHGRFSGGNIGRRFGSWNRALELAGLAVNLRRHILGQELLADVNHVADLLRVRTLSQDQYTSHGKFGANTLKRKFGSWVKVLAAARLEASHNWRPKTSDDALMSNMAVVWEYLGRQPTQSDFRSTISKLTSAPYIRKYGSWRKALEAFVTAANGTDVSTECIREPKREDATTLEDVSTLKEARRHITPRNPSWRLRFLVMRDDDFKCRGCGRSPATHPNTILEVDHIRSWDDGGETEKSNLQTLCQRCNGGKSNLPMQET